MFASATCQRSCLTEEIDDAAAPTSAVQERKIIMRCKSFVDVCNNIFRATWRSFMMRRLKTRRAPQRSHEIPSITRLPDSLSLSAANKNNPICANAAEFESPSIAPVHQFVFSPKKGLLPRVPSSPENYRFSMLGKRAHRSQQTEKQRQATGDEIRAGLLIRREKPRRFRRKICLVRIRGSISGTTGGGSRRKLSVLSSPRALSYFLTATR